ncbi:PAS domain S-box-containing protein [Neorhizobium sp. R1-B]|uniref:sensor histidine kinase n=1 Tax=Neorhizobium TaxID=1525371 RepID=UPI000CF955A6|nr:MULTISPECIES: PAS domain-containing sensor histidine kinase [Neorhizobium]TCV65378.1 PAS domain S-box-containing protein [Neorhizobium sp. S3-V5DH]TDX83858.1 PAS domain S-box-containing protein [Neorhizobium sp. R1-B]
MAGSSHLRETDEQLQDMDILQALFEGAHQPILIKDDQSRFLYLNKKACDMIGMKPEHLLGRTGHEFLQKSDADRIRAIDVEVMATGQESLLEEEVTGRGGVTRILVTHKRRALLPIGGTTKPVLIAVISDITKLRRAEQVLRASEEHYRSFVELHPQTPWVADASGDVIEVGPSWQHASGLDLHEALGRGWEKTIHPQDLPHVIEQWQAAVENAARFDMVYRIGPVKGRYRWFRNRAAPRLNEAGEVCRWYGLLEDVHDRQLALKALQSSEQRLREHRDRLEKTVEERTVEVQLKNVELDRLLQQERAINALQRRFVAMISHEFRTPLAVIDGAAQRLTRTKGAVTPQFLSDKCVQIKGAVVRMVELMESILAAGRIATGTIAIDKRPCSLSAVIEECIAHRLEISKDHNIRADLADLPAFQMVDGVALGRVFTNLLSNAVKYSPNSPEIDVRGWQQGQRVLVTIKDTGIGIDSDDVPKLFEPYFRARSATGIAGTGIGLNIVKEIIELHGGSISVESELGQGTTFILDLPFEEVLEAKTA